MARFPTLASLASASSSDVQLQWSGLGYYRRARFLHTAASHILTFHYSTIPSSPSALLSIPGIGPYTAGAIASIAYNIATPLVDGNVVRVLSRLRGVDAGGKGGGRKGGAEGLYWQLAGVLVEGEAPGEWNQALMELGATLCKPQLAECERCPVREWCRAYEEVRTKRRPCREGFAPRRRVEVEIEEDEGAAGARKAPVPSASRKRLRSTAGDECDVCRKDRSRPPLSVCEYPPKTEKKAPRDELVAVCVVRRPTPHGWELLLAQRPDSGLLAGQWEFPSVVHPTLSPPSIASQRRRVIDTLLAPLSLPPPASRYPVGELVHVFSHRRHLMHVEAMTLEEGAEGGQQQEGQEGGAGAGWRWVGEKKVEDLGLTVGQRKVWRLAKDGEHGVTVGKRGGQQGKREKGKGKRRQEVEGKEDEPAEEQLEDGGESGDGGGGEEEEEEEGQEVEQWEAWPLPRPVVLGKDDAIVIDDC